jgi:uncharacterized protein (TIGR02145 family)
MYYSRLLSILLFLFLSANSFAQTDTEFWFVAPEVSKNGGSNFDIPIYLRITTFNDPATVTVSEPANPGFTPIVINIPANGFSTADLSAFLDVIENKPANTVLNYGLHIVSTNPVSIYYEIASTYCSCNPELYTLKGKNAVGSDFLIPTQNFFSNSGSYTPTPYNAFDIVATEDNTTVTITPSKDIVGHPQNIPFEVVLNQGQTYSALATSQLAANHLFGSKVTSTKPVAITMTDDLLWGIVGCADIIGDQIVPVGITGKEYIAVKGNLTNDGNRAFILATQDNTQVFIDGNPIPAATLNIGQIYNDDILNSSTYIVSDKPVYVFQTSGFGCELGGALLPPIFCTGSTRVVFARTTDQQLGLVITTHNGDQGNFLVNGDPTMITAGNFLPVPGTGGNWVTANLTLSLLQIPVGTIVSVTNTSGTFHLGLMIGNAGGGCSYGYYSDFSRLNLGPDQIMCQGGTKILDAGAGWTSYLWSTGATTQSITANAPGTYWVNATDPGCTLSDTAVVSLYPIPLVDLGPDISLCAGQTATLTASGGPFPQYLWNTGATTSTIVVNSTGTYYVHVVDNNGCNGSDTIHVIVNPLLPVSVTVMPSANNVCAGTTVTFFATPLHEGLNPTYQWQVNGINAGGNLPVFSYIPINGDIVNCILNSSETCTSGNPASGNPVTMIILPYLPLSVTISASSNPFCPGIPVNFNAFPINSGGSSSFQWKVNGSNVGLNNSTFTYTPFSGDQVVCVLSSTDACITGNPATSNTITMVLNTNFPASVSITATINPFCPGTSVIYHAFPTNGGLTPSYQWKKNGNNAGTNSATFTYTPLNGDSIRCIMTSNLACVTLNPASSNTIHMVALPAPVVTFTRCFDSITRVNAKPIKLKGGIPPGGTYSGPGVNSITGVLTPSIAGIGTKIINYTYSNSALCSSSDICSLIIVNSSPFTCGNSLVDIRDNKLYPTVKIGSQCWMSGNLNYGIEIPSDQHQRDNCINEKYILNTSPVTRYAYYQWDEVMQYDESPGLQGLCPPGWHIPTNAEWNTLFSNYGNNGFAGSPLKYDGYSGFNAVLAGARFFNKTWDFNAFATLFWSSSSYGAYKAWAHGMNEYNPSVSLYPSSRGNAFSVRCLQDN